MPLFVMEDRSGSGLDWRAREANVQNSVREALMRPADTASSSVYSRSPNVLPSPIVQPSPPLPTSYGTKPPLVRSLFGLVPRTGNTPVLRHMPQFPNPFARGEATTYSPAAQPSEWGRSPMPAQPSPAVQSEFRHPADTVPMLNNEHDIEAQLPSRKKKHKRKHRKQSGKWTRHRKTQGGSRTCAALFQGETRTKAIASVVSGVSLILVLALYLSIAISVPNLNEQIHILFTIVVIAILVFFTHSLVRLIMLIRFLRHNAHGTNRHRPRIPSTVGPEGFKPEVPIPVQLARDEEAWDDDAEKERSGEEKEALKHPPPAYGLWRGSVRMDPNLLHWQRVDPNSIAQTPGLGRRESSRHGSPNLSQRGRSPEASPELGSVVEERTTEAVRRPPSYVSEDGVSYVVSALPPAPPSEIHPAFRIRL